MAETFFDECVMIADRFIRTVCFVDDQPFFKEEEDPVNEDIDHRLNADLITKVFASKGKSSTFYRYQNAEEEPAILKLINNSDVTVLDWKIVLQEDAKESSLLQINGARSDINLVSPVRELTGRPPELITPTTAQASDDEEDIYEDESRGKYAIMLLEKILTQKYGSPKLILIYTAETDFESIFQTIHEKLEQLKIFTEQDSENLWFQNERVRISIFFKQPNAIGRHISTQVKQKEIAFLNLPDMVNREFAKINNGLLASVVLKTVTKIRNHTNQVLNIFTNIVDPAFLSHRSLLTHPSDSEDHLVDIIGSEIKSIIKGVESGAYLSNDLLKRYIEDNFEDKDYNWDFDGRDKFNAPEFHVPMTDNEQEVAQLQGNSKKVVTTEIQEVVSDAPEPSKSLEQNQITDIVGMDSISADTTSAENQRINEELPEKIDRNLLIKFCEVGVEKLFIRKDTPVYKKMIFSDSCHKSLTTLFAKSKANAEESNNLFAMLTVIKSNYTGNMPILTQGTILKQNESSYWTCIQPKCDAVRIERSRDFLLASLKKVSGDKKFDFVLKYQSDFVFFKIDYTVYKMKFFSFRANSNQIVRAIQEDGKIMMIGNSKMEWIGELKSDFAQSIANKFSSNLSRVGMDHSEWLRRSS